MKITRLPLHRQTLPANRTTHTARPRLEPAASGVYHDEQKTPERHGPRTWTRSKPSTPRCL